jgi:hypothetical protein
VEPVLRFPAGVTQTRQLFFDSREFEIDLVVNNRDLEAVFEFEVDGAQRRNVEDFGGARQDVFQAQQRAFSRIEFCDLAALRNQVLEKLNNRRFEKAVAITHDDVFANGVHVVIRSRKSVALVDDFESPLARILHDQTDLRRRRHVEHSLGAL